MSEFSGANFRGRRWTVLCAAEDVDMLRDVPGLASRTNRGRACERSHLDMQKYCAALYIQYKTNKTLRTFE